MAPRAGSRDRRAHGGLKTRTKQCHSEQPPSGADVQAGQLSLLSFWQPRATQDIHGHAERTTQRADTRDQGKAFVTETQSSTREGAQPDLRLATVLH